MNFHPIATTLQLKKSLFDEVKYIKEVTRSGIRKNDIQLHNDLVALEYKTDITLSSLKTEQRNDL